MIDAYLIMMLTPGLAQLSRVAIDTMIMTVQIYGAEHFSS